ncbi:MAG: NAD(P)H-dependent oxidoreductase subunit E [Candidatus Aminicenantes bacterium]|nr:NAD(P)H-dependent oxidoreductase subunit E [Candidatus Aminicenantes bacterium]MCJ7485930.1 NAD(P)H-dependent oxidoreductase subunit E [Candidatus Aminicenantes bacterium]TFG58671.1 MAG: NAD(P)H-dependent oxidoreductase subunit E [Candidatus Aminicenantes bacterium]
MDIDETKVRQLIEKHQGLKKNLIAILLDVQESFNYLPPDALRQVAKALGMPFIDVIGVATFYRAFSLTPRGKHTCLVCLGTACHVRGGQKILEETEKRLGVPAGENTKDGQFTLDTVACLGCCAIGPVIVIDGEYFGHTTIRKVGPILGKYAKAKTPARKRKAAAKPAARKGGRAAGKK